MPQEVLDALIRGDGNLEAVCKYLQQEHERKMNPLTAAFEDYPFGRPEGLLTPGVEVPTSSPAPVVVPQKVAATARAKA